jgi:predicted nucleotidyltransferase
MPLPLRLNIYVDRKDSWTQISQTPAPTCGVCRCGVNADEITISEISVYGSTYAIQRSRCIACVGDRKPLAAVGSRAMVNHKKRGSPDEDSDVDLLVIVPRSDDKPTQRAMRAYRCLRGLMVPADILVKTCSEVERFRRVHASLESEILERGKILYG